MRGGVSQEEARDWDRIARDWDRIAREYIAANKDRVKGTRRMYACPPAC